MNIKLNTILGFLSVSAIVMSYAYLGVDDISAIEEVEDTSIGVSQVIEESCSDVITDTLEDNDVSSSNIPKYDALANIGTLQERIDLYNYLTSNEYLSSITDKVVNDDGSVSYKISSDAKYYGERGLRLKNGEIIEYIEYLDKNNNLVRLQSDGNVTLLVGEKYAEYYLNQLEDYSKVLDEINQELGTDYSFDFELSTFEDAEQSVDMYKSMTLDEFKTYMTNAVKETENLFDNVQ
ncbi:MAG: hypothetical protein UDO63_04645 [Oscillospiraceae bacterium]